MKKFLLIIAVLFCTINFASSQSLEFVKAPDIVEGAVEAIDVTSYVTLKNKTDKAVNVRIKGKGIDMTENHVLNVCWGECFTLFTDEWTMPWYKTIEANGTSIEDDIHLLLMPFETKGISKALFTFYIEENPNDKIELLVTYYVGVPKSVEEVYSDDQFGIRDIYPNPTDGIIAKFDINLPEKITADPFLEIYNEVGMRVKMTELCDCKNTKEVNVEDLVSGNYYCNVLMNGIKSKTKKLLIKR